jgi:adenosine deaminase
MRQAGLLATLNTDDPALTDLDLGQEYRSAMDAFGFTWDDMVQIALDGAEATWLDDGDKRALRDRIGTDAARLGAELD